MRVTYFVNAMVMLEGSNTRILCDPWVTFDNRSATNCYNFPKVSLLPNDVAALKPDYIYITHTHPDHFDTPTLGLFDRATPILVADYDKNFTARAVKKFGFEKVLIVPADEGIALNGEDHCWLEPAAVYPEVDSLGIFRLDGGTAINLNDNVFDADQIERVAQKHGPFELALIPSGAHGPWPMFFENYSNDEKARLAAERANKQREAFVDFSRTLQAKYVIPFAGGLICAGEKARCYGFSGINPRSKVVDYAESQTDVSKYILLSESNSFDTSTARRDGEYVEKNFTTEIEYIEEIANVPDRFSSEGTFFVAPSERVDLSHLLTLARKNQQKWQERRHVLSSKAYFFDVGEPLLYRLDLASCDVTRVVEQDIKDVEYEIFRVPYEMLLGVLTRHYNWSNLKTQHTWFYRRGSFDPNLSILMSYLQI